MSTPCKLVGLLTYYSQMWHKSLNMERTMGISLRLSFSFPDIDRFGEALFGVLSGLKGSGTKGSGADLTDGRIQDEVKTANLCQPSKCTEKSCKKSSPWSDTVCAHCGSSKIKKMSDSRFGISASAHLKDIATLRQYCFVAIEHVVDDKFSITAWTIQANDPYFTSYVNEQAKQSSKTCNLLPRSFDFLMSGAKQVLKVTMTLPTDIAIEPTVGEIDRSEIAEPIPYSVLNGAERKALGLEKGESIAVERAKQVLSARKKSHGKARGTTSRHVGDGVETG
jgi:hypothetical protein